MTDHAGDAIVAALTTARKHGFSEVELEADGVKFKAKLVPGAPAPRPAVGAQGQASALVDAGPREVAISAPCVGFFQSANDSLSQGCTIQAGEIVATVQALGIANDVVAPEGGEVMEILVRAGDPVQFGQPIALLKVEA
ncbi:MAG: hypothetical protein HZC36_07520 [Armatimonadetes bacterium]|nr:hypothetical protein [Armatimonadota bacterium]